MGLPLYLLCVAKMTKKLTIVIMGQGIGIIRSLKVFFYFPGAGLK
jgi:hypothetical protein